MKLISAYQCLAILLATFYAQGALISPSKKISGVKTTVSPNDVVIPSIQQPEPPINKSGARTDMLVGALSVTSALLPYLNFFTDFLSSGQAEEVAAPTYLHQPCKSRFSWSHWRSSLRRDAWHFHWKCSWSLRRSLRDCHHPNWCSCVHSGWRPHWSYFFFTSKTWFISIIWFPTNSFWHWFCPYQLPWNSPCK